MGYTVAQVAEFVGGILHGESDQELTAALPLLEAHPQAVTFATKNNLNQLANSHVGAVLIGEELADAVLSDSEIDVPLIVVKNPLSAILKIAGALSPPSPRPESRIDPRAAVDPGAQLGPNCYVGPFAVIEADVVVGENCDVYPHAVIRSGCRLGDDVQIHSHVVLYPGTVVGDRCTIHGGAVIGGDGYGYQFVDGRHEKIPQIGVVQLGDDVEIGANSTVDRATFGTTRIGEGTKIDNLVMVGHNTQIGKHNILVSQVGIAGSCNVGDYVMFGGQAGIADHVTIGDKAKIGAGAGVFMDCDAGKTYLGSPGRPEREAKRHHLNLEKVPEMRKQLQQVREVLGLDDAGSEKSVLRKRAAG